MIEKDKLIKELRDRIQLLDDWLHNFKKAQENVLKVQFAKDMTEWELNAIQNLPKDAENIVSFAYPTNNIQTKTLYFANNLPNIDIKSHHGVPTSMIVSGTPEIFAFVENVEQSGLEGANEYCRNTIDEYRVLQKKQEIVSKIIKQLEKLGNEYISNLFIQAINTYSYSKTETISSSSTLLEMRTFLDKLQGELFDHARNKPNEKIDWGIMAERLVTNYNNMQLLIQQGEQRKQIVGRLSQIGKQRQTINDKKIEILWFEVLDHLYSTLELIFDQ